MDAVRELAKQYIPVGNDAAVILPLLAWKGMLRLYNQQPAFRTSLLTWCWPLERLCTFIQVPTRQKK